MRKAAILRLICVAALLREKGTLRSLGSGSMSDFFPLLPQSVSVIVRLFSHSFELSAWGAFGEHRLDLTHCLSRNPCSTSNLTSMLRTTLLSHCYYILFHLFLHWQVKMLDVSFMVQKRFIPAKLSNVWRPWIIYAGHSFIDMLLWIPSCI